MWEPLSLGPGCQDWPSWGGTGLLRAQGRQQFWAQSPGALSELAGFSCTHLWALPSLQRPLAPVWVIFSACSFSSPAGAPSSRLFLGPHLQRPQSQVLSEWQRKGQVLCPHGCVVPNFCHYRPKHVSLSVRRLQPSNAAGPIAWPWPLQTLCAAGAAREPVTPGKLPRAVLLLFCLGRAGAAGELAVCLLVTGEISLHAGGLG